MKKSSKSNNQLVIFSNHSIRRIFHDKQWWFVVVDVVAALTDSTQPAGYLKDMRQRDLELSKAWSEIVATLPFTTAGGVQKLNCANTESILRIIQSISSPKAEPFKRWLATVGYERIQEIENPALAAERARAMYKAKGYPETWIEKRMRGIEVREELTEEWQQRDVGGKKEYAILTAEISKAAFGLTPAEYKKLKGLKRENLRDHMSDLELIFTMLGEASTTEITRETEAQGFAENKETAKAGGEVAGNARKDLERRTHKKVSTSKNHRALLCLADDE